MMTKLYPPYIEGTIPAFYSSEKQGTILKVPYSMNRAVGWKDFKGFDLKIKTVQNNSYILNVQSFDYDEYEIRFVINKELNIGQFYKIQIAYIDNNNIIGFYSTIGITKFTTKPEVGISNLKNNGINNHRYEYVGTYSQKEKDITERVYKSYFKVWDNENKIIAESGDILHNRLEDIEPYESFDRWMLNQELEKNKTYYIQYTVITLNSMEVSSPKYRIMQKQSIEPNLKAKLDVSLNFDNGYIDLKLIGDTNQEGREDLQTGAYLISRASSKDDYKIWNKIYNFSLQLEKPSRHLWRDFTIEQGVTYIYSIQQYNDNGLYSERLLSEKITADFEDSFLFDGERQLKIRFNPKISSFKTDILESKVDTLGGKHPFIFRNGHVSYKEFPISGLISYQMDEANFFISEESLELSEKTTNLTRNNIYSERNFKLAVLDWLNNGKPKVFRSPTEGNYIVRLMNINLSPNDSLGRMLHTFNCNAYEIAEYTYENLNLNNFIYYTKLADEKIRWETIEFSQINKGIYNYKLENGYYELLIKYAEDNQIVSKRIAQTALFKDLIPGTKIQIKMQNSLDYETIQIGVTGSYIIEAGVPIVSIKIPESTISANFASYPMGNLTYSYYSVYQNVFDLIEEIDVDEIPLSQYIGKTSNIIEKIEDVKTKITQFFKLNFSKRPLEKAYAIDGALYQDINKAIPLIDPDAYVVYKVYNKNDNFIYYWDGYLKSIINDYCTKFYLNGNEIDLNETENYSLDGTIKINSLILDTGVMAELSYQAQIFTYSIENKNNGIVISDWELLNRMWNSGNILKIEQENYNDLLNSKEEISNEEYGNKILQAKNNIAIAYNNYIGLLTEVLKIYKEDKVL